jgi:hypothetical protein
LPPRFASEVFYQLLERTFIQFRQNSYELAVCQLACCETGTVSDTQRPDIAIAVLPRDPSILVAVVPIDAGLIQCSLPQWRTRSEIAKAGS